MVLEVKSWYLAELHGLEKVVKLTCNVGWTQGHVVGYSMSAICQVLFIQVPGTHGSARTHFEVCVNSTRWLYLSIGVPMSCSQLR